MKPDPAASLHILNASSFEHAALAQRLTRFASSGDGVLLIENGVHTLQDADLLASIEQAGLTVYALTPDVNARHLPTPSSAVTLVDDVDFVSLCCAYRKTISWVS